MGKLQPHARQEPCLSCPYRRDVPSGVWAADHYEMLRTYDAPTAEQPTAVFACHATPDHYCNGWVVVSGDDSLALRLASALGNFDGEFPTPSVPLFATHTEACEHGLAEIDTPSMEACDTVERLLRKFERLELG